MIYCNFHGCKNDNFPMKNCDIVLIFTQNIDCGYKLEPPCLEEQSDQGLHCLLVHFIYLMKNPKVWPLNLNFR